MNLRMSEGEFEGCRLEVESALCAATEAAEQRAAKGKWTAAFAGRTGPPQNGRKGQSTALTG
jgi:hypothetical protein